MKKLLLPLILVVAVCNITLAQKVALTPAIKKIQVSGDKKNTPHTDTTLLSFVLIGSATGDVAVKLRLELNLLQAGAKDITPFFVDSGTDSLTITIPSASFAAGKYYYPVFIQYNAPTIDLTNDVTASIIIDGSVPVKSLLYQFSSYKTNVNDFWVEVGANFDLLNGVDANNLYAGVFAFEKDLVKNLKIGKWTTDVSFTGGVYEAKSSGLSSSSDSGWVYRNGASYINIPGKGYPIYRDTGSISTKTVVQSIGLFFSPQFKLNQLPTNQNGFHWYASIYVEMLWQRVQSTFDYTKTRTDTTMYLSSPGMIYGYPYKENNINLDYRSHYFGVGLPIYIKHDDYTFYLNSVFGWTSQRFAIIQGTLSSDLGNAKDYALANSNAGPSSQINNNSLLGFATPKKNWNTFYIEQFRLTSEKYGVSFTGEVRGFFLGQSKPIVTLAVSKKFDIGSFFTNTLNKNASQ